MSSTHSSQFRRPSPRQQSQLVLLHLLTLLELLQLLLLQHCADKAEQQRHKLNTGPLIHRHWSRIEGWTGRAGGGPQTACEKVVLSSWEDLRHSTAYCYFFPSHRGDTVSTSRSAENCGPVPNQSAVSSDWPEGWRMDGGGAQNEQISLDCNAIMCVCRRYRKCLLCNACIKALQSCFQCYSSIPYNVVYNI